MSIRQMTQDIYMYLPVILNARPPSSTFDHFLSLPKGSREISLFDWIINSNCDKSITLWVSIGK